MTAKSEIAFDTSNCVTCCQQAILLQKASSYCKRVSFMVGQPIMCQVSRNQWLWNYSLIAFLKSNLLIVIKWTIFNVIKNITKSYVIAIVLNILMPGRHGSRKYWTWGPVLHVFLCSMFCTFSTCCSTWNTHDSMDT